MARTGRTILGVVYSSLVLGTVLAPYLYIGLGALSHLVPGLVPVVVPVLLLSTCVVILSFMRRWNAIGMAVTCLAFLCICALLGLLANFGLPGQEQYWVYLILAVAVSTVAALVMIVLRPPSRMEYFISSKTSEAPYRAVGYILLAILLAAASLKLRQYFVYSHRSY